MMLLSRFWYAILAVALAAAIALLYVSIHQHNRLRESDTRVIIDHDRDIVDWYLRIDARRRLDTLAIVSIDDNVRSNIVKANGQDKVDGAVREAMKKRLGELAQKISGLLKDDRGGANPIMLFAVDARGRVVGSVNFDRQGQVKDENFELGGFPVVADALHGWLRDDTWVFDRDAIYRVVARPVVAAEGAPAAGAVVALRRVDDNFARLIAERTETPVLFYVAAPDAEGGAAALVARAIPEKADVSFDGITIDTKTLTSDKGYGEQGASALKQQGALTMAYSRLVGAGWNLGAGYAVARKVTAIADPNALLAGADESDKKAVPVALVAGVALVALLIGLLATYLEHSVPTGKLVTESRKFAKGDQDALPLGKLSGPYRKIGHDVNEGVERVISKGGGASRKAADLEQILGPVPAAPQMSAFSFNLEGQQPPASKGGGDLFPNLPPAGASPAAPAVSVPMSAPSVSGSGPHRPPAPASPSRPQPGPAPMMSPPISNPIPAPAISAAPAEDDEATMVARIPDELMAASKSGEVRAIADADELVQWKQTFEEFVAMRAKCGEPTTGLSFDKFQVQLKKNKEQLVKQYNCRRVKFTVYEKDGKAALKATPIKE